MVYFKYVFNGIFFTSLLLLRRIIYTNNVTVVSIKSIFSFNIKCILLMAKITV